MRQDVSNEDLEKMTGEEDEILQKEDMDTGEISKEKESIEKDEKDKKPDEIKEEETSDDVDKEIQKLTKKLEDMKSTAQRTQADFINYKKRVEKEKADISAYAIENLVTQLLGVLDNFDRAMDAIEDKENDFYKGVDLIKKQLFDCLVKQGLEEIEAEDADFDPNIHHAVLQEEKEGVESGKVIEVLQKGFKLKNRVIRAAMVKVSQ